MKLVTVIVDRNIQMDSEGFTYFCDENISCKSGQRVYVQFGQVKKDAKLNEKNFEVGLVIDVYETNLSREEYENLKGFKLKDIIKVLDEDPIMTENMMDFAKNLSNYYKTSLATVISTMFPPVMKVKKSALKHTKGRKISYLELGGNNNYSLLSEKQLDLINKVKTEDVLANSYKDRVYAQFLVQNNYLKVVERVVLNDKKLYELDFSKDESSELVTLKNKLIQTDKNINLVSFLSLNKSISLMLDMAKENYSISQSTLIIVPSLGYLNYIYSVFNNYFDDVDIYHSSMSDTEIYQTYEEIKNKEKSIVIATQIGAFLNIKNLRTILVLNAEDVSAYKRDGAPTYRYLDVFMKKVKHEENCKLFLLSKAPTIELYAYAKTKKIGDFAMKSKESSSSLVIDMTSPNEQVEGFSTFSQTLLDKIDETIKRNNQVILVENRKGYSSLSECSECGTILKCETCNSPLIYYKKGDKYYCNHCHTYLSSMEVTCKKCFSQDFEQIGFGMDKTVEDLNRLRPNYSIQTLTADVKDNEVKKLIYGFNENKFNILVATNAVLNVPNYKNVGLIAFINADLGLSIPFYNSEEIIYQNIVNIGDKLSKGGALLIQTYNKEFNLFKYALTNDYEHFFEEQLKQRKQIFDPPYSKQILIRLKNTNSRSVFNDSFLIKRFLVNHISDFANIYGPNIPYISREGGKYIINILIKYKEFDKISSCLDKLKSIKISYNTKMLLDMDPVSI